MNTNHYIITGTSRGIGEQIARLLLDKDNVVFGISRGESDVLRKYKNYKHCNFDLSNVLGIEQLVKEILEQINFKATEMICLINNAAMLEPLKTIERCNIEEISKHIHTSLIAPMALTSCFISQTDSLSLTRKIINISSGSGTYPAPGMSVYCTAKAGINMFTQCVGAEQVKRKKPIEIIAIDPGMVETEMQKIARGKQKQDFEMVEFFNHAYQTEQLQSTEEIGRCILNIIEKKFEPGMLVNYSEGKFGEGIDIT